LSYIMVAHPELSKHPNLLKHPHARFILAFVLIITWIRLVHSTLLCIFSWITVSRRSTNLTNRITGILILLSIPITGFSTVGHSGVNGADAGSIIFTVVTLIFGIALLYPMESSTLRSLRPFKLVPPVTAQPLYNVAVVSPGPVRMASPVVATSPQYRY